MGSRTDAVHGFGVQRGIAHHALLAHVAASYLELRLDHEHHVASWITHPGQGRQYHRKGDERQIGDDEVDLTVDV